MQIILVKSKAAPKTKNPLKAGFYKLSSCIIFLREGLQAAVVVVLFVVVEWFAAVPDYC